MRTPKLPPTPGARRLKNIPIEEFYLGLKVRSLMTGNVGIVGEYSKHEWDDEHLIDILWKDGKDSSHYHSDYDMIEELLEEEEV
jgi:hypothetical protein